MLRFFVPKQDRLQVIVYTPETPLSACADAVWCDLNAPTPEEDEFAETWLGVPIPTREEMKDIEPSARLYVEDGAEVLIITAIANIHTDEPIKTPLTFILKGRMLVTVRYSPFKGFSDFEARVTRASDRPALAGEAVMLGLLEAMVDRIAYLLELSGDDVDHVSHEVFRTSGIGAAPGRKRNKDRNLQALIEKIGRRGEVISLARECLVSTLRLASFHQTVTAGRPKSERDAVQELKTLQRDCLALTDHVNFLSGKLNFLLDATLGLINLEQNQIIKIFSIAAVVLLPPTVIGTIYGMNFTHMPELDWTFGYPMALGLMVVSAALPYLFFKRQGWL